MGTINNFKNNLISKDLFKNNYKQLLSELSKRNILFKNIYLINSLSSDNNTLDFSKIKNNSLIIFNNLKNKSVLETSDFRYLKSLNLVYIFNNCDLTYVKDFKSTKHNYNIQKIINNSKVVFSNLFFENNLLDFKSKIYILRKDSVYYQNDLVLLNKSQKNIIDLEVIHSSKNTTSKITTRNVLKDSSFVKYNGLINIIKGSEFTKANLQSSTMLLSKKAKAIYTPMLEIIPRKVKASHSASNDSISKDTLFFLESKGIPKAQSKKIIVSSFLEEFISNYPLFLKEYIYNKIKRKL